MSIIANKVRYEGNSVYLKCSPHTGIIALTSFTDSTAGVDSAHTFTKTFRYSTNGIIYSGWQELNTVNIQAIELNAKDIFVAELCYTLNQSPTSQQLVVYSASFNTTNATFVEGQYFKNTVFYDYFQSDDIKVLEWMINVLDKLYEKGLIPAYMDRVNDAGVPDDFLEFWGSICKYFSFFVIYARTFENFPTNYNLLTEYLIQRGISTSPESSLPELNYIMTNFYRQIFNRGTVNIVKKEIDGAAVDGELLRLIHYKEVADEFIFNPNLPQHAGWNVGNSSPMYRSQTIHDNANKFYEQSSEPVNILKYPTQGTCTIVTDGTIGKKVINCVSNAGIVDDAGTKKIKVDENMDYEFSFYIKKTAGNNLTIGFEAYDIDGATLNLKSRTNGTTKNLFFDNKNTQRSDKYLYFRGFLYNKMKPVNAADTLNLKMVDGVKFITPIITIGTGATMSLYNIRFCPMATQYSKGFIQVNNWIDLWIKNNNNQHTVQDIHNFTSKYLLPYSSHLKITETQSGGDFSL